MNWWILAGVAALVLLAVLAVNFGWIDLSNKSKKSSGGSGGSLMGIGDEVFAPTRHEAQIEMDRQSMLPAPAPVAGDGDKGIFDGKIEITLRASQRKPAGTDAGPEAQANASADPDSRDAR